MPKSVTKKPNDLPVPERKSRNAQLTRLERMEVMRQIAAQPMKELELSPQHLALLRQTAYLTVLEELGNAAEVLAGGKKWDNAQVRLFGMLLNKVMPDVRLSHTQVDHHFNKSPDQLTREQLEGLVIEAQCVNNGDAVETTKRHSTTKGEKDNEPE